MRKKSKGKAATLFARGILRASQLFPAEEARAAHFLIRDVVPMASQHNIYNIAPTNMLGHAYQHQHQHQQQQQQQQQLQMQMQHPQHMSTYKNETPKVMQSILFASPTVVPSAFHSVAFSSPMIQQFNQQNNQTNAEYLKHIQANMCNAENVLDRKNTPINYPESAPELLQDEADNSERKPSRKRCIETSLQSVNQTHGEADLQADATASSPDAVAASSTKYCRNKVRKIATDRKRRTKIKEGVEMLKELLNMPSTEKTDQVRVVYTAVDGLSKLRREIQKLQDENEALRRHNGMDSQQSHMLQYNPSLNTNSSNLVLPSVAAEGVTLPMLVHASAQLAAAQQVELPHQAHILLKELRGARILLNESKDPAADYHFITRALLHLVSNILNTCVEQQQMCDCTVKALSSTSHVLSPHINMLERLRSLLESQSDLSMFVIDKAMQYLEQALLQYNYSPTKQSSVK